MRRKSIRLNRNGIDNNNNVKPIEYAPTQYQLTQQDLKIFTETRHEHMEMSIGACVKGYP